MRSVSVAKRVVDLTGADAGNPGDQRDPVDVVVHRRALVVQAMRAGELAVVGGEEHGGVVGEPAFVQRAEHPADLLVDQRDVAPVRRDQLAPVVGGRSCRTSSAPE